MSNRLEIESRQAPGPNPNPPNLLAKLVDLVSAEFPEFLDEVKSAGFWKLRSQKAQDVAKIAEIKAGIIEKLANCELEREKMITERIEKERAAERASEEDRHRHAIEVRNAQVAAALKVIESARAVKDLGIELDVRTKKKIVSMIRDLAAEVSG